MDETRARTLLKDERTRLEELLATSRVTGERDRATENDSLAVSDSAEPLVAEGLDDAVALSLRERLAAIERAERRVEQGTFGRSVHSGDPIPDERLEADPAAELTIEEARLSEAGQGS